MTQWHGHGFPGSWSEAFIRIGTDQWGAGASHLWPALKRKRRKSAAMLASLQLSACGRHFAFFTKKFRSQEGLLFRFSLLPRIKTINVLSLFLSKLRSMWCVFGMATTVNAPVWCANRRDDQKQGWIYLQEAAEEQTWPKKRHLDFEARLRSFKIWQFDFQKCEETRTLPILQQASSSRPPERALLILCHAKSPQTKSWSESGEAFPATACVVGRQRWRGARWHYQGQTLDRAVSEEGFARENRDDAQNKRWKQQNDRSVWNSSRLSVCMRVRVNSWKNDGA